MKSCQLCGACSWGPAPAAIDVHCSPETYLVGRDLTEFRKCDMCGALACLKFLQATEESCESHTSPPGPLDAVQQMLSASFPKADNRTERIMRALLTHGGMLKPPAEVVRYARELESELEASGADWMTVRFADQRAMETWLAEGLKMTTCPEGHEVIYARQFAQWAADKVP